MQIKEAQLSEAFKVKIPEWDYDLKHYQDRIKDEKNLVLVCYIDGKPVGYWIGYDRFKDKSFYCWMTAVHPASRRKGVLKDMFLYAAGWAKKKGYKTIRIKTRNCRREMLLYLVRYGFDIVGFDPKDGQSEYRIMFEKNL